MAFDAEFHTWWGRLSEDHRARLKAAAGQDLLRRATTRLLLQTACPLGPIGTRWESPIGPRPASTPEINWIWPAAVREFVLSR